MTPFYKKALQLFTRTQEQQIQKGLAKYPEPFNPHSWTPEELLNHALEETVDLTHYLVGLKELLDAKDRDLEALHKAWSKAMDTISEKNKEIEELKEELRYEKGFHMLFAKEVIKLTKTHPNREENVKFYKKSPFPFPKKVLVPDLSNLETKPAVIRVSKSPFEEMMEQAKRSNYPREKYDMNFNPHLEEQHERLPLNKERPCDQDDQ